MRIEAVRNPMISLDDFHKIVQPCIYRRHLAFVFLQHRVQRALFRQRLQKRFAGLFEFTFKTTHLAFTQQLQRIDVKPQRILQQIWRIHLQVLETLFQTQKCACIRFIIFQNFRNFLQPNTFQRIRPTAANQRDRLQFRDTLRHKVPLIVYPEGTTSDGRSGLKEFKTTPFETVCGTDIPIQPMISIYRVQEGDMHPAWYGDATFMPHLWAILGNRRSTADVYILPLIYPEGRNRKQLAKAVRDAMLKAYCEHTGWVPPAPTESPAAPETKIQETEREQQHA